MNPQAVQLSSELDSSSPQAKVIDAISGLNNVLKAWPRADSPTKTAVGLDSDSVSDRVVTEIQKLKQLLSSTKRAGIAILQKNVVKAKRLLDDLNVNEEAEFRRSMKSNATQIAKVQTSLQASRVALSLDGGKTYNFSGDDTDEKDKELWDQSISLGAKALYMVCVYTAITLHRSAATWQANKKGTTQKVALKMALRTLNTTEVLKVEEEFQHDIVKEMRRDAKLPRPPRASSQVDEATAIDKVQIATDIDGTMTAQACGHVEEVQAETTGEKPTEGLAAASVPSLELEPEGCQKQEQGQTFATASVPGSETFATAFVPGLETGSVAASASQAVCEKKSGKVVAAAKPKSKAEAKSAAKKQAKKTQPSKTKTTTVSLKEMFKKGM